MAKSIKKKDTIESNVLVLASGGIDSTACLWFYKKLRFNVTALFVDYGQIARHSELKSIKAITKYYKIKLLKIDVKSRIRFKGGLIVGRNNFLFSLALMNFTESNGIIASGIHAGTRYYDCSEDFVHLQEKIFQGYSQGTIMLGTPFLNFNKMEIYQYSLKEKVPLKLTYSCELGAEQPCGKCSTCKDLEVIYAGKNK